MIEFKIIAKAFPAILITISFFIITGRFFLKLFSHSSFYSSFEKFYWYGITGLVLTISVYAIYTTKGRTILAVCPVLLFLFVKSFSFKPEVSEKDKPNIFLFILVCSILYFLYYLNAYFSYTPGILKYPSGDYLFYARLSEYFNKMHLETSNPEYILPVIKRATPYHFGDIWTGAAVSNVFKIRASYAFALIVYPVLGILTALGTAGYIAKKYQCKSNLIWMAVLTIFISGIISLIPHFSTTLNTFEDPVSNFPKALWAITFLVGTLYFVSSIKPNSLIIFSVISGIMFLNILPALWISAVIIMILLALKHRISIKTLLPAILTMAFTLLYYYLFYSFQRAEVHHTYFFKFTTHNPTFSELINAIYREAANRKNHILIFLPFLILYTWSFFSQKKSVTQLVTPTGVWMISLIISGFLCWMVLARFTVEARQFYNNIFLPVATLSIFLLTFLVIKDSKSMISKYFTFTLIAIICYKNFDFKYNRAYMRTKDWKAINTYFAKNESPVFVNYINEDILKKYPMISDKYYQPVPSLNYFFNGPYIHKMVNSSFPMEHSTSLDKEINIALYKLSDFYQFKSENNYQSNAEAELAFIKHVKAKYLIVPRSFQLPEYVKINVYDSMYLPNEKIFRFKQNFTGQ